MSPGNSFERFEWKCNPVFKEKLKGVLTEEEYIAFIINRIIKANEIDWDSEIRVTDLIDCFRLLTNRLGSQETSFSTLKLFVQYGPSLWQRIYEIVKGVNGWRSNSAQVLLRAVTQFLTNVVIREEMGEKYRQWIWQNGEGQLFFFHMNLHSDGKVRQWGWMVMYYCLEAPMIMRIITENVYLVQDTVQSALAGMQFAQGCILKMLMEMGTFLGNCWPNCRYDIRMGMTQITRMGLETGVVIHRGNIAVLVMAFVEETAQLLETIRMLECGKEKIGLIDPLLNVLCRASSSDHRYIKIRHDQRLLESVLSILKITGKWMTVDDQLEELTENTAIPNLQSRLVRLLANLCYQNPTNQKLVREYDGIESILDYTQQQLDQENPIVTEWTIFELKNITGKGYVGNHPSGMDGMETEDVAIIVEGEEKKGA